MKRSSCLRAAARALTVAAGVAGAIVAPVDAQPGPAHVNPADVQFMSGMLMHHAQAVVMGDWAPSHDPRVGLHAGWLDAGEALWNMQLVSFTPRPQGFVDDTIPAISATSTPTSRSTTFT